MGTHRVRIRDFDEDDRAAVLALADRLTRGVAPWREGQAVVRTVRSWVTDSLDAADPVTRPVLVADADRRQESRPARPPRGRLVTVSSWIERMPLVGLLLPVLTILALLSATGTPEPFLAALTLAGAVAMGALTWGVPLTGRLVSVQQRSEVCRHTGVRSCDPDRPGPVRPRAPGLV